MADVINAAEMRAALQQGQRMFRAFRFADETLASLDSLETVIRERQAAADALNAQLVAAQADLTVAQADATAAKAEAKSIRAKAKSDAEARASDAAQKCSDAMQEAQARVDALRNEAESVVADLLSKRSELDAVSLRLDDAREIIAKAERKAQLLAAD